MDPDSIVPEELVTDQFEIALADHEDRTEIYRQRFQVYAKELGQHTTNGIKSISDPIDEYNHFLVVKRRQEIVGFVSITPTGSPQLSIDKYLQRNQFQHLEWETLFELRLLTVVPSERQGPVTGLLLYGAARWLQQHDARHCIAMGRQEVMRLYRRIGFSQLGKTIHSGQVKFELMMIERSKIDEAITRFTKVLERIVPKIKWKLGFPSSRKPACYHGGASIESMACDAKKVAFQKNIINADVLDAWFPPSAAVTDTLAGHLPWLVKTSPPVEAHALEQIIAEQRGLDKNAIVAGAGASDLIFRAFQSWLCRSSHVLLVAPCYGEYKYVCQHAIGCQVDQLKTSVSEAFFLNPEKLIHRLSGGSYDLVVIVNPNNPTGVFWTQDDWDHILDRIPSQTRIWIDECYIDFVDSRQSMEQVASISPNLVICKSLSKCLALSGLRVGYLTTSPECASQIRGLTPPWNISTLGQLAAAAAIKDPSYYQKRYQETHQQRRWLESKLTDIGLDVIPGTANFSLAYLPKSIDKTKFLDQCRAQHLFIRDLFPTSPELGHRAIRVATKSSSQNKYIIDIMRDSFLESRN